ncbi:transporter substrate-binding domain-containing protein [Litoribacillus peritrichatus]|uniref:Solute-binding protein family 3/N-terminal domain-containing protein n=1 Tax=Litoribacillus peritrichatus TaxID=718191 RepID=A0ABP7NAU6_9GAMM
MSRYFVYLILFFLVGCGKTDSDNEPNSSEPADRPILVNSVDSANPLLIRNLDAIKKSGVLRVVTPRWDEYQFLPRQKTPANYYRAMVAEFAERNGLDIRWIYVDQFSQLTSTVLRGRADVIVANMTVTDARAKLLGFTVPVDHAQELLVVKASADLKDVHDLALGSIVVPKNSSFKQSLDDIAKPGWSLVEKEFSASPQALVDDVISGKYTATVVDSNVGEWLLTGLPVKSLGALGKAKDIAWAVHLQAQDLLHELNQFIHLYQIENTKASHLGDWPEIVKRRTLTMITRNSSDSYFMWRGELMGYEYDLVKRFAEDHKLYLDVVVADKEDMIDLLLAGEGDLVASSQAKLESRRARGVEFTETYNVVDEVLVGRKGLGIEGADQLSGHTVMVEAGSSYLKRLNTLKEEGADFKIVFPEDYVVDDETDIMGLVADGVVDFTVVDDHLAARELLDQPGLVAYFSVAAEVGHGWVVRKENTQLLAKLNAYIKSHFRGLYFNVTWQKYFDTERGIYLGRDPMLDVGQLSPYDVHIKEVALQHDFDWRMIVAQMYQESRFNPKARSHVGALGVMQVLPRTARDYGVENLYDPEVNIRVGVEYLGWVRQRFPKYIEPAERTLFALAGYNAGYGHVLDARRLAAQKGWDRNRWFGHVEKAMLLLSERKYARNARFGYVRGKEPVEYVRQIHRRYLGYVAMEP